MSRITDNSVSKQQAVIVDAAVCAARIMQRCELLAACSEQRGQIDRPYLSTAMRDAHGMLREWMLDAGLTVRTDAAGNLIGRRCGASGGRVLIVGSHIDSVPNAGRYDGVLGVMLAVEAVCQLADQPLPFHIDVVAFSEEEGVRFALPYLGSRAVCGTFDQAWLERLDSKQQSLRAVATEFGLNVEELNDAVYDPAEVIGYVEPHLEQGPVLERAREPIGIVNAIAGQSRLRVRFSGKAEHAGTTPMAGRQDALVGAARWVVYVNQLACGTTDLIATVGYANLQPNAPNVIPSEVTLSLDVRHAEDAVRESSVERLLDHANAIADECSLEFEILEQRAQTTTQVDPGLTDILERAALETGHRAPRLASGAGHDAVPMAERFPVAMLFVRHPGGISHHPDERVDQPDVASALKVLTQFIHRVAERETA